MSGLGTMVTREEPRQAATHTVLRWQRMRPWWPEIVIVALASLLRLLLLEMKPPHFDEGVNGFFVDGMKAAGFYSYDPTNFHGPLHFYILFIFQTLFGRHIWVLRLPVALLSTACVGVLLSYRRYLPPITCRIAALAMALSPAMTFYGRYAIHESLLLFSLLVCIWGILGLHRFGDRGSLWAFALGLTGMVLTKETYVIHIAALLLAYPTLLLVQHLLPTTCEQHAHRTWTLRDLRNIAIVCGSLLLFFYTGGFMDWTILPGMWTTFLTWTRTGTEIDGGHAKPISYWLELMRHFEWPALLGLIAIPSLSERRSGLALRYLTIAGLGTMVAYSIVNYKTPWCIIVLLWPFFLVLGAGVERSLRARPLWISWIAVLLCTTALAHSAWQNIRINFFAFAEPTEPYVYVQTTRDLEKLMGPLRAKVQADRCNYHLSGVILFEKDGDNHPLPWLLGDFTNVELLSQSSRVGTSAQVNVDFLLVEDLYVADIEDRLKEEYYRETFTFRGNSGAECNLYLRAAIFHDLFPDRVPEFRPYLEPALEDDLNLPEADPANQRR